MHCAILMGTGASTGTARTANAPSGKKFKKKESRWW